MSKRNECGCHKIVQCEDSTEFHVETIATPVDIRPGCESCCRWPECLTEEETQELMRAFQGHDH